jgi:hypothetical protein
MGSTIPRTPHLAASHFHAATARTYWLQRRDFASFGPGAAICGAARFQAGAPARAIRELDRTADWVRR